MLKTSDFDYKLPKERIATRPLENREAARMMVLNREQQSIAHASFSRLCEYLRPGDRLVFNDTRVIPGRVMGRKKSGAAVEILFTEPVDDFTWKALVKPGRKLRTGAQILVNDMCLEVRNVFPDGNRLITSDVPIREIMESCGEMPIPPYMERHADARDKITYQTVFARKDGAVAAPTAGLHFTDALLDSLGKHGVDISYITLHVGVGTFRPVKEENPLDHPMHSEYYEISPVSVREIEETRKRGGRIIAVGTTVVRTLESAAQGGDGIQSGARSTDLMIFPGYEYKIVDGLITNFHLPRSTLLMLVSAFYRKSEIFRAYEEAVRLKYRFYSYGDGMLII
ncbi:MAG: tRNA preQ1(34) S-adenosylmethionine ribosyltransferase-isomerase QueA [Fibrobacterota bacterium]